MSRRIQVPVVPPFIPKDSPDRVHGGSTVPPDKRREPPIRRSILVVELHDAGLVEWSRGERALSSPRASSLPALQGPLSQVIAKLARGASKAVERLQKNPLDAEAREGLESTLIARTGLLLETRRAVEEDFANAAGKWEPADPPRPVPGGEMNLRTARGIAVARLRFDPRLANSGYGEALTRLEQVEKQILLLGRMAPRTAAQRHSASNAARHSAMHSLVEEMESLHALLRGRESALLHHAVHVLTQPPAL